MYVVVVIYPLVEDVNVPVVVPVTFELFGDVSELHPLVHALVQP